MSRLIIKVYKNQEMAKTAMFKELTSDARMNQVEMRVVKGHITTLYRTKQHDLRGIRADQIIHVEEGP